MSRINPRAGVGKASADTVPAPVVNRYQQLATDFIAALNTLAASIPEVEAPYQITPQFASRQRARTDFVLAVIGAVERTPDLQLVNRLDVVRARDMLAFIDAFGPVLTKIVAFTKTLRLSVDARRAVVAADTLQIYDIAKGMSRRDANSADLVQHVETMRRQFRKAKSKAKPKVPATPPPAGS